MYAALAPTFLALAVLAAACSGSSAPEVTQTSTPAATPSPDATATLDETLDAIEARTSAIRGLESDDDFNVRFASEAELAEIVDGLSLDTDTGPLVTALGLAASNTSIATSDIEGGAFVSPPATIFVVGDASDGLDDDEVSIYVHEYTHFLQEAVFGSPDIDPRNLDAQFAQVALR